MNSIFDFIKDNIVLFDIIFLTFIIYFAVQCFAKGFFLSFVSFLKWILALIITIILVPKIEPLISDYIENQFISGVGIGIVIYVISLFILILIGKSLGRLFSYSGLGPVDKTFGLFFGVFKGYVFAVCIFTIISWFYSYEKWDISINEAHFFNLVEKGSKILIEEFPGQDDIENTKETIEKI